MKNVLLIGLGRFGFHMAQKLHELHHQVLAIDKKERRVQDVLPFVTNAEIADCGDPEVIKALGVSEFDLCVVTMGHDLQASLEVTALLKEYGAQFVLTRVETDAHAKFLLACGADEVIYPEKQLAEWAAVRYSSNHIHDYVKISKDHVIYETDLPKSWVGHTIVDLAVRQRYHINILAICEDGEVVSMASPTHRFKRGERIIIMGSERDVEKFLRF